MVYLAWRVPDSTLVCAEKTSVKSFRFDESQLETVAAVWKYNYVVLIEFEKNPSRPDFMYQCRKLDVARQPDTMKTANECVPNDGLLVLCCSGNPVTI